MSLFTETLTGNLRKKRSLQKTIVSILVRLLANDRKLCRNNDTLKFFINLKSRNSATYFIADTTNNSSMIF